MRRRQWFGLVVVLGLGFATGLASPVRAAHVRAARRPGIVGTYHVVSHATTKGVGTYYATFHIDTFDPSTGAIRGHGEGGGYAFTITGTVKGTTLVMQVTAASIGYAAFDRGTIAPNGNISGTLTDTNHNTGMWTMTRLATSPGASQTASQVVAVASGFDRDTTTGAASVIDYGVVLKNRSSAYDAINLTVSVRAADRSGRSVATDEIPVTLIPAGGTFVVAGLLTPSVSLVITRLHVTVKVGQRTLEGHRLPAVSNVKLDASGGQLLNVTGRVSNPYQKAMSQDAPIYAIFLNAQGGIVGGANDVTGAQVRPGATVSFGVQGVANNPNTRPVSARVSVDPCSETDVLYRTCEALARH